MYFSKTRLWVLGIGLIVIGLGVTVYGLIITISMKQPAVDLYNTDWESLRAFRHVEVDMDFLMDYFMVTERDGKETSRVYALPDLAQHEDGMVYMDHYMGVVATSDKFERYDAIADASLEWWGDETGEVEFPSDVVHMDGYLRKMSSNEKKYIKQLLKEVGYSDDEISQYVTPYVLMTNGSNMFGIALAGLAVAALGAVFTVFAVIKTIRGTN